MKPTKGRDSELSLESRLRFKLIPENNFPIPGYDNLNFIRTE